jgi:hypothetical protein
MGCRGLSGAETSISGDPQCWHYCLPLAQIHRLAPACLLCEGLETREAQGLEVELAVGQRVRQIEFELARKSLGTSSVKPGGFSRSSSNGSKTGNSSGTKSVKFVSTPLFPPRRVAATLRATVTAR